jgi:hypothetical protein
VCEFDASLTGICVIVYQVNAQGREAPVGVGELPVVSMGFGGDSAWQNLSEFLGAVLSLVMAASMGATDQTVLLRGDSVAALTWATEERYRGWRSARAAVAFTLLAIAANVDSTMQHIDAASNWRADKGSRRDLWGTGESLRDVVDSFGPEFAGVPVYSLGRNPEILALLAECKPHGEGEQSEAELLAAWGRASAVVQAVRASPPIPDQAPAPPPPEGGRGSLGH